MPRIKRIRSFAAILGLTCLAGPACSSLQKVSAGQIPCSTDQIKISDERAGPAWTAECKNISYSCRGKNKDVFCAVDEAKENTNKWAAACADLQSVLKSHIGKQIWFNPASNEKRSCIDSKPLPTPFSKLEIIDAAAECGDPDLHLASDSGDQKGHLTLSDGQTTWNAALYYSDYKHTASFEDLFYHEPNLLDGCYLPWNPKEKFSKLPWTRITESVAKNKFPPIGASKQEAIFTLGKPSEVNRTMTAGAAHEQWIYGFIHAYLYFDNDKLTAVQQ